MCFKFWNIFCVKPDLQKNSETKKPITILLPPNINIEIKISKLSSNLNSNLIKN
jgi:hypothetical protein